MLYLWLYVALCGVVFLWTAIRYASSEGEFAVGMALECLVVAGVPVLNVLALAYFVITANYRWFVNFMDFKLWSRK